MATQADRILLTAEQFLRIDFGPELKAELDNGVIRMMAGGSQAHARVQMNLYRFLGAALRGSGCRPFGSDMAIRTRHDSVRYPDMSISCAPIPPNENDVRVLADPQVIIEILSSTTRHDDEGVKLDEYLALASVAEVALINPETERVRIVRRDPAGNWHDHVAGRDEGLMLESLGIAIPHSEIFARD